MKPEQRLLDWCKHKLAELRSMAMDIESGSRLPRSQLGTDLEELEAEYRSLIEEIDPLEAFVHDCEIYLSRSPT